jgi:DNA-binding beta-propeller fold protein YncE
MRFRLFQNIAWGAFGLSLLFASVAQAQAPVAPATLVQTIDLGTSNVTPVTIVVPSPPQPAPGFSLTGIAFDPVSNTIHVSDYATTNVYAIDGLTNTVTSAVYTNGLFTTADIGPTQDVAGQAPTVVLVNPATNRWMFTGEGGGAEFTGTTFDEPLTPRSMQSGAAWDPATDNVYAADGLNFFASNNAKFLLAASGSCNAVAVNPATSRVYASCGGSIVTYDGFVLSNASVKVPTPPLAVTPASAPPMGLAVNPNTNRIYVAGRTSLDVLDASSYQFLGSIPGLPDQSADSLVAGYLALPLPRPVAVNTLTNTIFVVNSVSSTISVFDGNTNTLIGTIAIPVPNGASVSQPVPAGSQLSEIKPGNTYFDSAAGAVTTLGGAIAIAVNESANLLYVASVNGTVGVYAMGPAVVPATFSVNGVIRDAQGAPVTGVTVNATGPNGSAAAVTDATGLFVLTGLPAGSYTIQPVSEAFSFAPASQAANANGANVTGLVFAANPPLPGIAPTSLSLDPWTMIGPGVSTTATATIGQPAPAGGLVLTLASSNAKAAKVPATATVPAGQSTASFQVQGSGVSAATLVTVTATFNGASAATSVTVAPGDKLNVTGATYSKSQQLLQVKVTGTNAAATVVVQNANTNAILGTMVNLGNGSYTFQMNLASGIPTSVNVISNLGGKTGQGVASIQ